MRLSAQNVAALMNNTNFSICLWIPFFCLTSSKEYWNTSTIGSVYKYTTKSSKSAEAQVSVLRNEKQQCIHICILRTGQRASKEAMGQEPEREVNLCRTIINCLCVSQTLRSPKQPTVWLHGLYDVWSGASCHSSAILKRCPKHFSLFDMTITPSYCSQGCGMFKKSGMAQDWDTKGIKG